MTPDEVLLCDNMRTLFDGSTVVLKHDRSMLMRSQKALVRSITHPSDILSGDGRVALLLTNFDDL